MKLVDHFVSEKGVIFRTYEPDGNVQTGTFTTKEPSEAEAGTKQQKSRAGGKYDRVASCARAC